jgi:glycosyltransferase involved in cell wall biosynthesis
MRVGFDAALLGTRTTGIGLYTEALARALSEDGASVVLMGARGRGDVPRRSPSRSLWFTAELPLRLRSARVDLFHGVNNFQLPLVRGRVPFVITVHDLIPELMPETVSLKFRWQFQLWLRRTLEVASAVICISETTRRDLLALHPIDPARVHVVHNGVDHVPDRIDDAEADRLLAPLSLPSKYFLCAGALDPRKNVGVVVEAIRRLGARHAGVSLVIAGQDWFGSNRIGAELDAKIKAGAPIRRVGFLPERTLFAAMQRAVAFVFPSRYEGFGLPPLEAMRLGTPALVSDAGALPEICGEAATQLPSENADVWARAMQRLLEDGAEHERLARVGRERARTFTWRGCARQTRVVYESVVGEVDSAPDDI